jgi:hypothetical protein
MDKDPTPSSTLAELERLWQAMTGRLPTTLARDLRELEGWFGPTTSGEKLRELVEAGTPAALDSDVVPDYGAKVVIEGGNSVVVTPEGRMAIELLRRGASHASVHHELAADGLAKTYRRWTQHRLTEVIDQLEGRGKPMYPVAIGAVLLLAVNGNESESRALLIESGQPSGVGDALKRPLDAFADAVERRKSRQRITADFAKYPVAHAKIRLGCALRRERAKRVQRIWLDPPMRDWALDVVAHELVARRKTEVKTALDALDRLLDSYREGLVILREHQLSFSNPDSLADIRHELAGRFTRKPQQLAAGVRRPAPVSDPEARADRPTAGGV